MNVNVVRMLMFPNSPVETYYQYSRIDRDRDLKRQLSPERAFFFLEDWDPYKEVIGLER